MSTRPRNPPPLHELETEVMEEVWQRGEATVREVMEAINARQRRARAYTTFMTIMSRLDRKGVLARRRHGRADVYRPTLDREAYLEARARAEVDAVIDDHGDLALAHFARQMETLDAERRRQLRRLARGE